MTLCAPAPFRQTQPTNRPMADLDTYVRTAAQVADDAGLPPGWCITAAGVSREVLTRLGIPGVRVIGVDVAAFNATAWRLMRARVPMQYWPDDAWSVGTGGTDRSDSSGWDGHALAYIPSKAGGRSAWIVDPSAGQFSRPSSGLTVTPLYAPVPNDFLSGVACPVPTAFGGLILRHNPRLTHFRSALASCEPFVTMLADETERRLRDAASTA